MHVRKSQGFTLIELLIVIALIAVLAGAVVISLNPARQFQQARDSERWSHVSAIAGAITQNITENRGTWNAVGCSAASIPTTTSTITSTAGAGNVDLCGCLVPNFTSALPADPSTGTYNSCADYDTGYQVVRNAGTGRITVLGTGEITSVISVTQ